jgi:hypothetical protein
MGWKNGNPTALSEEVKALALLAVLFLFQCSGAERTPIATDRAEYPFGDEVVIVSTLSAPADRAAHVENCNGAITTGLQRQSNGKWVDAWIAATNACRSAPIVIPAGGSHAATLLVRPRAGAVVDPPGRVDGMIEPGKYRVVWFGVDLPLEQRVSEPIEIR